MLAKQHHPDKGGDPGTFSKLQLAYETLSDPRKRQVYDTWAKELQFRYVRTAGSAAGGQGGEDILLDEFDNLGLHCDPATQLVVTCEVCRRPATKQCWTCGMQICEFCTLKRHWRVGDVWLGSCGVACEAEGSGRTAVAGKRQRQRLGPGLVLPRCTAASAHHFGLTTFSHPPPPKHAQESFPLHWPLINSDHMRERLARRELERKRIEDAAQLALEDPHHRSDPELRDIRAFKDAAQEMLRREDSRTAYDLRLARFYMWAQTPGSVLLACRVPTGYADRELVVEASPGGLLVQAERSPPLIDRLLDGAIDPGRSVETFQTADHRVCVVVLPKAEPGQCWPRLFRGDSVGLRCMEPPYTMAGGSRGVAQEQAAGCSTVAVQGARGARASLPQLV